MATNNAYALDFSSVGGIIYDGSAQATGISSLGQTYSVDGWLKTSNTTNYTTYEWTNANAILEYRKTVSGNNETVPFSIGVNNSLLSLKIEDNSGNIETIESTSVVADGVYHHFAVVVDNNDYWIYIDGVLDNSGSFALIGDRTIPEGQPATIALGERLSNSGGLVGNNFNGELDEIKIWSSKLAGEYVNEVKNKKLSSPLPSDLLAYYRFEDNTASTSVIDYTGNYNVTLSGTPSYIVASIDLYGFANILIKDGADYKYHNGTSWQIATSVAPTEQDYLNYGMKRSVVNSITETQWNELANPEISFYTDDTNTTSIATTVETNPFTLGEALGDNPTFHFYTDDPNKQPILETDTDEFGFYDEMGSSVDILYYTDDASVTSPQVEFEANYTPLDEINEDFDIVTWTNKPKEEVVETLTTTQSGTLTDGDTYSVSVDLTKGNGVKKIDEV